MKNLKLVIFAYDFPNRKCLNGMQIIKKFNPENVYTITQPWLELNITRSQRRIAVFDNEVLNPTDIAKSYGWSVLTELHNSKKTLNYLRNIKPDYGIILGARILSAEIIECFSEGIINFHPGVLPENRGLDTVKWAINNDLPQGITTHFIDEKIDVGQKIYLETAPIEKNDSIYDINSKLVYIQMKHLHKALNDNFQFSNLESLESKFPSRKAVPEEIDIKVFKKFEDYKKNYEKINAKYVSIQ
ncbi:MAG: hypothetical protein CL869_00480 [Cytophagia bacterium]|nr:hypothetical protein [Cytophagia bacterium]|tara:strand:+ start:671 stop:1402 length:732 start_codon:yes stop_codon:yes gene_type:complete